MKENDENIRGLEEDLKKVEKESLAKLTRHRADDYIAIIIGVGSVLILWLLQFAGCY